MSALDRSVHLHNVERGLAALQQLEKTTSADPNNPEGYIGSCLMTALPLLVTARNALGVGEPIQVSSNDDGWIQVAGSIHRWYVAALHTHFEAAVIALLEIHKIEIQAGRNKQAESIIASLSPDVGEKVIKKIRALGGSHKQFADYLEAIIAASNMKSEEASSARSFLRAWSILRNKCSHADQRLKEHEEQAVREGGLIAWFPNGMLAANFDRYPELASRALELYRRLAGGISERRK